MTVNVYPSTLTGEPIERHHISGVSLHDWLAENAPGCLEGKGDARPISASINGQVIPPAEWPSVMLSHSLDVDLRVQPQGLEGALIAAVVAGAVASAAAFLLKPSIPNVNSSESAQGARLLEVNAQGNQPKLGDVIPDQAGRCRKYPDILTAPVRRFLNERSQELYLFFSLGVGEFERDEADLLIGETPVSSIPGVSYQFFEPGESVSAHPAAANWYNAPEVGASTGASGLRLRGNTGGPVNFSGLASTDGTDLVLASDVPSGWDSSVRLRIQLFQPATVGSNGTSIFGNFQHLADGMPVRIQTPNLRGNYRVRDVSLSGLLLEDINTGALIEDFPPGDYSIVIDRLDAVYRVVGTSGRRVEFQRMIDNSTDDSQWTQFPNLTGYVNAGVYAAGFDPELWTGPFLACPKSETTNTIEWDVFFPRGLGKINNDGGVDTRTRDIELQWRALGDSEWNSIIRTIEGNSRDQLGFTFSETLPVSITPEVRVRRLTIEDTSTQALDRIEWYGLRSRLPENASYEGVSTLAMVISGSDLIASQTENQINLIETRKLPVWNGSEWTAPQATRDIAPYVRYAALSRGYTDDDIDMEELLHMDALWKARGDTFDFIFDRSTTLKDCLNTVLRAGMAELTISHGKLKPVREGLRTVPEHMYTLQNMTGELRRKFTGPRLEDPDGIDVEYRDENSWTLEVVECRLPGDAGVKPKKVRLDGVVNRDKAYQIGMRERSRLAYQRWEYDWSTECDGLNSQFKSFCALADDVPLYGRSALLLAVEVEGDDVHLQSSEPFDWQEGESYVIAWRRTDGSLAGPYPAQRGDADDHVVAQMGSDPAPVIYSDMEPPHLLWGTTERWCYQAIVEDVEPEGFESVTLRALNYDARVYAYDDALAPG